MVAPLVASFGEVLIRLSTPGKRLLRSATSLDVNVAGAEANVAVALASLGHATRMIGRVADNELGELARASLRSAGVDTSRLTAGAGRMGVYFLTPGAGLRASSIVYDRVDSAFARCGPEDFDWDACLAGVSHLHLSGVTPALGPRSSQLALHAARAARAKGISVIVDGNYRARLWDAWDSDPRTVMAELIDLADIFFGNHRDVSFLLGRTFDASDSARRRTAAEAAFVAFPRLKMMASTSRHVVDADCNRIAARIDTPESSMQTEEVAVSGIVDRVGSGDAFAAGVLHGMLTGGDLKAIARAGLALTCLKHSVPGDFALFTAQDIAAFHEGGLDVRR